MTAAATATPIPFAIAPMGDVIARTPSKLVTLGMIAESPFNRRRRWGDLNELADSMKAVGVLTDLVARPTKGPAGSVELVFGHRRFRAAKIAKLETVPVKVLELSDDQVVECQVIENLQRTDLHELEEAETFELLMKQKKMTAEELARQVGRARGFVFQRMKLLSLVPSVRKAFAADEIPCTHALYLARMPPELQPKALADFQKRKYDGELPSAREAHRIIEHGYMLKLAEAGFDRSDAELVPKAGACTTCPMRTGSQPELFGDVDSKDICTNPPCFHDKTAAHTKAKADELKAKGVKVVAGEKHSYGVSEPSGYVPLSDAQFVGAPGGATFGKPLATILKNSKTKVEVPKAVYFDDKGHAVPIVERTKVPALLKAAGVKTPKANKPERKKPTPEEKAAEKNREAIVDRQTHAVVAAVEKQGVKDELLRVLTISLVGPAQELRKRSGNKLAAYCAQAALDDSYGDDLKELAKGYGVDLKKIEKEVLEELEAKAMPAKDAKAVERAKKTAKTAKPAKKGSKK